jgi:hypothetical protein
MNAETRNLPASPDRGWLGLMMAAKPSQTNLRNRNMAKKSTTPAKTKATPKNEPKITAIKKGEIYENKHHDLIEVANGRLKDEGDLGSSFEGRTITFNAETKTANRDKDAERFYLDELVRKLSKAEYDEWIQAGCLEADAAAAAKEPTPEPTKGKAKKLTAEPKAKPATKDGGKMSALDAAAKVLTEAGAAMTTGAMIEQMAAKNYWVSPGGKTPAATLYAAILREITTKGTESRFVKADRGLFAATK